MHPLAESAAEAAQAAKRTLGSPVSVLRAVLVRVRVLRPNLELLNGTQASEELRRVQALNALLTRNARRVVDGTQQLASPSGALMRSPAMQLVIQRHNLMTPTSCQASSSARHKRETPSGATSRAADDVRADINAGCLKRPASQDVTAKGRRSSNPSVHGTHRGFVTPPRGPSPSRSLAPAYAMTPATSGSEIRRRSPRIAEASA